MRRKVGTDVDVAAEAGAEGVMRRDVMRRGVMRRGVMRRGNETFPRDGQV